MAQPNNSLRSEEDLFSPAESIYIFGTTLPAFKTYLFLTSLGLHVHGFVCDYTSNNNFKGVDVFSRQHLDSRLDLVTLVNCTLTSFKKIRDYYEKRDNVRQVTFYEIARRYPQLLNTMEFFCGMHDELKKNRLKYEKFAGVFADQLSREMWFEVLDKRNNLSFDITDISFASDQYFPDVIRFGENEVMIDAGANEGETISQFIKSVSRRFKTIHVFEPQKKLIEKCKDRFSDHSNIVFHEKVLTDSCEIVNFSDEYGSGSSIAIDGVPYQGTSIDAAVTDKVTFFKIDVEGAEVKVLKGSSNLIKLHRPKIAVCVYHKQEHFLDIPELILSMRPDYKVYFRHHSPGIFESVMYFI